MNQTVGGIYAHHIFGFSIKGKAYLATGNLRIEEFDDCGECANYQAFTGLFYQYDPEIGYTDLTEEAFPPGKRGYAIGDIMYQGDPEKETLYFGFGLTRYPNTSDPTGESFLSTPRWGYNDDGTYTLANRSSYPRLNDLWSFDGETWTKLADCPGIGRSHPGLLVTPGKVYIGGGFGEFCPQAEPVCEPHSGLESVMGGSGNLKDSYVYDVETDEWTQLPDLAYRNHHPYQFGIGDQAYFLAGHDGAFLYNDAFVYEADDNAWGNVAPIPGKGRVAGAQFSLPGDKYGCIIGGEGIEKDDVVILAGYANSPGNLTEGSREHHRAMPTSEFMCYVQDLDTWIPLPNPPGPSRWAPTAFIHDGYIYYLQGVIRQGQVEDGDFSQTWPEQGYRVSLDQVMAYLGEMSMAITADGGERDDDDEEETDTTDLPSSGSIGKASSWWPNEAMSVGVVYTTVTILLSFW